VRDRVWVAAGFSGHGFMQAPAVGRILAEAILDGREDEALRVLDAARFAENRLVPEPQVV
jgi:glycine/D-amino acid oxidase-like deaminating enzyme